MNYIFLTSGLLLGWTFGANGAANLFGTAVGTKMLKFRTAAIIASIGMVAGAVLEGGGASETLGQLGAINASAGAFTVALAAGATLALMAKLRLPGSTSQAIVGGIVGWNLFSGASTDYSLLAQIATTWFLCPALAAFFAIIIYFITKYLLENVKMHLLTMDAYTRYALIIVGAFGAYSFGANNIANVMGVFVSTSPFKDIAIGQHIHFSSVRQLFLLGGIAIAVGVFTYSKRVMKTVGRDLYRLTPVTAFIVVLSHSLVLYFFASNNFREWLISLNLPTFPLVPVSSSQAIIGGVIGIALAKGGRNLQWGVLGKIFSSWITTPIIAGFISFFALFIVQNVFDQKVYDVTIHSFPDMVIERLEREEIEGYVLQSLAGMEFSNTRRLRRYLNDFRDLDFEVKDKIVFYSTKEGYEINRALLKQIREEDFTATQLQDLYSLKSGRFLYSWEIYDLLSERSDEWKLKPNTEENIEYNEELKRKYECVTELFKIKHN
ncbi:MAG: inorganic phosphate transporter [Candidatus Cloacimonas sp.]|nr:inorganic phosphate transporter family protein [Candidatus Cloacimonadota bacterium]